VVPYARGREVYRSADEILKEVENLIKRGYKEINLIAQNVNSYTSKLKIKNKKLKIIKFPELLQMINDVPGDFWIRFSTSHPKDMSDDLIQALVDCEKVCKYVHLPAQAGDNEVLKNMNRNYTIEHYKKLIKKIRKKIPGVAISTDIIVGFPGESEEQFQNTVKLFKELNYDLAYIAQYSPRYGTKAAKMKDDVPQAEKKLRNAILEQILRETALENNKKYIGKEVEILVDDKDRKGLWQGKTETYKNVRIKNHKSPDLPSGSKIKRGDFVKVKITSADVFGLEAKKI
jgi:tRNA-2-methylthio-N6-dimethylallyladenosine synthase